MQTTSGKPSGIRGYIGLGYKQQTYNHQLQDQKRTHKRSFAHRAFGRGQAAEGSEGAAEEEGAAVALAVAALLPAMTRRCTASSVSASLMPFSAVASSCRLLAISLSALGARCRTCRSIEQSIEHRRARQKTHTQMHAYIYPQPGYAQPQVATGARALPAACRFVGVALPPRRGGGQEAA